MPGTLASTNRVQLGYIKETNFGVTPGTGNGTGLRFTGESLNFDIQKEESKEIRADRQNPSTTTVDGQAAGSINFHMQYAEYDRFLEALLGNTYTLYGTQGVGTTFSATFATGSITASVAPTGSSDFTTLQKGQWIKVTAPTHANDGKWVRVSTVTAPTTTVITLDTNTPLAAGGPIANSTISAARLANGLTQMSFSIEKQFLDIAQYLTYRGMNVSKMSLNFQASSLTDGSIEFIGKDAIRSAATQLPGTLAASNTFDVQNGVKGVTQLWENNAPLTSTYIRTLSLNVDANMRARKAVGNLGNVSIGMGDFDASGSMEVYFADGTLVDKFLNDTYTSLTVACQDTAGNGYVLTLPKVMLMGAKIVAGQKNADVMVAFDFKAYGDIANATAALQKTLFIDRLGVAAP
jgi:hypothetical protein